MSGDVLPTAELAPLLWVAILALALAAGWAWWRSRGPIGRSEPIRVVGVRGLGGKRLLALVEVEGSRLLLGLTDERIACLARFGDTDGRELTAPAAGSPPFETVLGALGRGEAGGGFEARGGR